MPVSAKDFHFGGHHAQYKQRIGLIKTSPSRRDKIRVLVLDSGIAADAPIMITDRRNLVNPNRVSSRRDGHSSTSRDGAA